MIPMDKWVDDIILYASGDGANVPRVAALKALRSAARAFLRDSRAWIVRPKAKRLTPKEEALDLPRDTYIEYVWNLYSEGETCRKVTGFRIEHPNVLSFSLGATSPRELSPVVSLGLTPDSTEVPDFLYDRYKEVLTYGALAHLSEAVKRQWVDPAVLLRYDRQFEKGIIDARKAAMQGFLQESKQQQTTQPNFM